MQKVLVTGASGLLGRAVLRHLISSERYDIYAVTTKREKLQQYDQVNILECDLTDQTQREDMMRSVRPEIMLHLAWNQERADFRMSTSNLIWQEISLDLLRLFEDTDGRRFLFAGSSSEYDGCEGVFAEDVDVQPHSIYGLCKKTVNEFARAYCAIRGIQYVGMRFFTIYGAEDPHEFGAIPGAFRQLFMGDEVVCNSPETTRDYIYAEDAAGVVLQLIEHDFCGIVNVASGKARTMYDTLRTIGEVVGKENLIKKSENPSRGVRFEADISLLKNLGIEGYYSDFKENIREIAHRKSREWVEG